MLTRRRSDEKLLEAITALVDTVKAVAAAAEAQARAVEAHIKLFDPSRAVEGSTGWVNRDEDEYLAELERQGFPRHGTQEEQLKWVQAHTGAEPLYELRRVSD